MKKLYTLLSLVLFSFAANAQCSDLFFSEYIEGSSNNKALEIYNASGATIDLSDYAVIRNNNGNTTSPDTFIMNGMLASEGVYIIANPSSNAAILAVADTTGSATFYNGDDALALTNIATSTVVDLFGIPGVDPGSAWAWNVGGVSYRTNNSTLVRNYNVQTGVAAWDTLEWVTSAIDDVSNLGSHSSACYPPVATEPSTAAADPTADQVDVISLFSNVYTDVAVNTWRTGWSAATLTDTTAAGNDIKRYTDLNFVGIETVGGNSIDASGMNYFTFDAWTPNATSYRIKLVDFGPDNAFQGGDDVEHELTFDMPAQSSWINHTIDISDFTGLTTTANISQLIFAATPAGGATLFLDNIYFSRDPVLVYNVADIVDIVGLDADFSPVNLDTLYEVTGIVYGIDYQGGDDLTNTNAAFTLIDATDGVGVFARGLDYVVKEGDEVTVKGTLDFFRGLTQIAADSITVVSTGNAINDPTDVTSLSEDTESDLVKFTKVWVADTADKVWPNNGNIDITNGTDTFAVRIDGDTKGIAGKTIEFDTMNIVGLGGQFDGSAPHNEGYQLFPRDSSDISEWVDMTSVRNVSIQTSVYPNPTSNNLTVVGATKWESFVVYSILGGEMAAGTLNNNNLSVANLNNGTYIIKLVAGEQVGVARFVVSK